MAESNTPKAGDLMDSNSVITDLLDQKLEAVEALFPGTDAFTFTGPLGYGADSLTRASIEAIKGRSPDNKKLLFILETGGGFIEVVERMVNVMRHHYDHVEFLIPDHAMSAGTVLAMSGDAIHMDYFSTLGPIDPQVKRSNSRDPIPVQGYLAQYEKLLEKDRRGEISTAELNILISEFDQAEIFMFEQALELSVTLLKRWLVKYKFKDWVTTESQGREVDDGMKERRAEEIARALNDASQWHTHGRGLPMNVLKNDLNLRIDDFGESEPLSEAIKAYNILLSDFMMRTRHTGVVHIRGLYIPIQ